MTLSSHQKMWHLSLAPEATLVSFSLWTMSIAAFLKDLLFFSESRARNDPSYSVLDIFRRIIWKQLSSNFIIFCRMKRNLKL